MKEVIKLPIEQLVKAEWNYKTDGTDEQIQKLMNSIEYDNSAGILAVRKIRDKYEVIDGNHRLEALRRLNYKEVQVENFGDLPKSKAIVLSRRRNHVWFDDDLVSFGTLLKEDVLPDISMETLKEILPEDENLENLLNFNEFEWKEPEQKTKDVNTVAIQFTVTKEVGDIWNEYVKENNDTPNQVFSQLVRDLDGKE